MGKKGIVLGKRGPKSKYDPTVHPQLVKWMCRGGLTNEQIAIELHIHKETLLKWAKENPEMADALKTSRNFIDSLVEDSLLKRALGYSYIERKVERGTGPKGPINTYTVTTKKVIPDVTAQIFWLKNRQREKWTDVERSGNTFNIMQGVLIVPGEKQPEEWDEAAKAIHREQEKLLSQD